MSRCHDVPVICDQEVMLIELMIHRIWLLCGVNISKSDLTFPIWFLLLWYVVEPMELDVISLFIFDDCVVAKLAVL